MTTDTQERSSRGEAGREEGGNRRADEGDGQDEQAEDPLPPVDASSVCLVCKKDGAHIQFAAWPCGCPSMCRACAQVCSLLRINSNVLMA